MPEYATNTLDTSRPDGGEDSGTPYWPDTQDPNKAKKHKKRNAQDPYGLDAFSADDPLGRVIFFGKKVTADVRQALLTATIEMTMDQSSQLEFKLLDNNFRLLGKGIYEQHIPVVYEDLKLEVSTVTTADESGAPSVTVQMRPVAIRLLKRRRGSHVMTDVSPSDFVRAECSAVNVPCVVQESHKRKTVARDIPKKDKKRDENGFIPSSWTTFARLAEECGFVCFEAYGTIYFAKPTWLMDYFKNQAIDVYWGKGGDNLRMMNVPDCSRTEDSTEEGVTVSFNVARKFARRYKVGRPIHLHGVPTFDDLYIIKTVSYSLLNDDIAVVEIGTPIDPAKTKVPNGRGAHGGGTGSGECGKTSSLRVLCQQAGFTGDGLEIAIAVAMAESSGNAGAIGDTSLTDAKWGPSVGLFQIRSLKNPGAYSGTDARRIYKRLLDARYNAKLAFDISRGGWGPWTTYNTGSYKKFYKTGVNYQVKGWSVTLPCPHQDHGGGSSSPGATGARSASAFAAKALQQCGDAYVYGDEGPDAFDCSGLVVWAAAQVGVGGIPRTSAAQAAWVNHTSVEDAIRTRGALLFQGSPVHHVEISLGNGRTVAAVNPGYGVTTMSATGRTEAWSVAGRIRGMNY
jgi:hypothetical protein